jgi:hypothetical protein
VIEAMIVVVIETAASAIVGPGWRLSAIASGNARNGSIVVRKRGPMKPPPKGR